MNPLSKSDIDKNPFKQFENWFEDVVKSDLEEPSAMIVATSTRDGVPSIRTVLLKGIEDDGYIFYTNYESQKGRDLIENPYAALLFYWDKQRRQVRISGRVKKVSYEKSEEYFKSRPRESQIGAWASQQSRIIPNREFLEARYREMYDQYDSKTIPLPPYWGGFKVIPDRFEFWQGRESRLHDRICYIKKETKEWHIVRLAP